MPTLARQQEIQSTSLTEMFGFQITDIGHFSGPMEDSRESEPGFCRFYLCLFAGMQPSNLSSLLRFLAS